MKRFSLLILFPVLFFSCDDQADHPKGVVDSQARKLNDRACMLTRSGKNEDIQQAIGMLDQATKIDSNYFTAYWNKLAFLDKLKEYDRALATAKELNRLKPNDPVFYVTIGTFYQRKNDSVTANTYFQNAMTHFNAALDTLSPQGRHYDFLLMNKGIDLIMLGKMKEGNDILQQLYDSHSDSTFRKTVSFYMNKDKKEIVDSLENNHTR